jgi:hypothetical protein|tara:strand:+ start:3320 stop:3763 length:444 start_codon:yes stop_codon:yes gene_type:complete
MLDNELIEILKLKAFKNVFAMLEYLTDVGCNNEEIIGIIPHFFTELEHFKDVAYGRVIGVVKEELGGKVIDNVEWVMFIGMISDDNRNLRGMFNTYRQGVFEGKVDKSIEKDMENLCKEKYEFRNLPDITIDYFRNIAIKHYGYALL